jgi:hypothetical protein
VFRGLVADYIQSLGLISSSRRTVQTDTSQAIRDQINLSLRDALESCQIVGESMMVNYSYQGYRVPLNLLRELFDLRNEWHISPAKALDGLDRAIGEYERRKQRLYWQMFNPLFWLQMLLVRIIGIPFQILGAAGFDAPKLEKSMAGRIVKAVEAFVFFAAALLTALQILGWLAPVDRFFRALLRRP